MKIMLKNILHSLDINRPKHRHILIILKYTKDTKYKKRLDKMVFLYIKQHLNSIWGSVHQKPKKNWGCFKKAFADKKARNQ